MTMAMVSKIRVLGKVSPTPHHDPETNYDGPFPTTSTGSEMLKEWSLRHSLSAGFPPRLALPDSIKYILTRVPISASPKLRALI